jgi:hypothetical protein
MPKSVEFPLPSRPAFDGFTHCTVRCSKCQGWLKPFALTSPSEPSNILRARIWRKAGWQVNRKADGKTLCPDCLLAIQQALTPPDPAESLQTPLSEQEGMFG